MRKLEEKIMKIKENINKQVDDVKQELERRLDTLRRTTYDEIEFKREELMRHICKANDLFEKCKLG